MLWLPGSGGDAKGAATLMFRCDEVSCTESPAFVRQKAWQFRIR